MVITIGGYTLCDGADRSVNKSAGPSNLSLSGTIKTQAAEYLRAADAVIISRGNRTSELTFSVKRQCSSESAAEAWAMLHPVTATRSGTVVMSCGGSGSVNMYNAVLEHIGCSLIGATVLITYRITGGQLA